MNHYQQQYSARPQQPLQAPHAPISPYFAARQRFEQSAYPAQSQSQAIDQHPRPPQHPKQQQRAGTHQHTHPHSQTRAQVQQRLGPQLQAQSYNMPPSQYAQVQQPPYQPQYAQQSQRMQTQAPYAPQYSVQATSPSAPYGQRTYSYPPLHSQARVQPAPAPTLYQAQQPYTSSYNAQAARAYALLQAQQTPSYVRPAGPPQATATAVPGSSVYTPSPQNNPGAGGRRPLPTPSQARPRPLSMPPQPAQGAPSARIFGHSSSSSLSHIIPQPSMTQPSPLPISPLPAATSSASPKRRPLPSPSPTSGSAPLPPASPASVRPAGSPGSAHMTLGQIPSSEKSPSSSYVSITSSQASAPGSPQKTPTQRRALPQSPSVPPDLSQIHRGGGTLARNGTVIHLVSQFGGKGNQVNPSAERGNIKPQKPTSQTPTACSSYMPRSPVRASTLPATVQSAPLNPLTFHQAPASQVLYSDEEGAEESGGEGDMLSEVSEDSAHQSHGQMPSPQYGIRDLPKRNTFISGPPGREVASKPESSPQYGIKDLPTRAKSVIDRRRAWERAEQGMNNGPVGSSQMVSNSGSKTAFEPNKRIFEASTPAKPPDATLPPPVTHISPSRSPQPQTPQQEQKLPMPAVQHPQPSYTDRQPSWTLPTADLERIEKRTHSGEQKTSMAFKFATMSLAEENTVNANAADAPSHTQTNYRPLAQSSTSRSGSPKKPYPFGTRTPRTVSNTDLSLDDAPPPSLRRTPSPSLSAASSSAPSIPTSRTPDDVPDLSGQQHNGQGVSIPKIDLPDDFDYDNNIVNVPSVEVQVPSIVVSPKPMSPRRAGLPVIIFPDDEGVEVNGSGPAISVTSPAAPHAPMPVILDDLVSSPSKSRGLPRPPSNSSASVPTSSSSSSNLRSRGGGLVCGGCQQSILGRIVSAMGLRWHPQCFKCCTCGELLEHVSSYENDGKPYCHLDYHELFAPQCYHCKTPIIDERFITLDDPALGKRTYHEQHFFCAECGDPFLAPSAPSLMKPRAGPNEINIRGDGAFDVAVDEDGGEVGFTVYRGHPYCEACHVRLRAPKCKGCKRSIRDGMRAVEALGGKWCFECFVCTGCHKPFEEPSFFQRGKMPYCEPCFSIILRNEI